MEKWGWNSKMLFLRDSVYSPPKQKYIAVGISGELLFGTSFCLYKILWREWCSGKLLVSSGNMFCPPLLAFIFYNHTHGREMVDIFVHELLSYTTTAAGLVAFMEFLTKNNVLLELMRSSLILLQGTWFWQVSWDF